MRDYDIGSYDAHTLTEAVRRALTEVALDDNGTLDRGGALHERHAGADSFDDAAASTRSAGGLKPPFHQRHRRLTVGWVDQTAVRAKKHLDRHNVRFQPGE